MGEVKGNCGRYAARAAFFSASIRRASAQRK
jgi:hypothetical protein